MFNEFMSVKEMDNAIEQKNLILDTLLMNWLKINGFRIEAIR